MAADFSTYGQRFNPTWTIMLQVDTRILAPFFRTGIGEQNFPIRSHIHNLILVLIAGWIWIGLIHDESEGSSWVGLWPVLTEAIGFQLVSMAMLQVAIDGFLFSSFAILVFIVSRGPAKETAWRAYEEREIQPSNSVGWPRLIDIDRYLAMSPIERRREWSRVTCRLEFQYGFLSCFALFFVSPLFATYLFANVFMLWLQSFVVVVYERLERIKIQDQMCEQTRIQTVFEEAERAQRRLLESKEHLSWWARLRTRFRGKNSDE